MAQLMRFGRRGAAWKATVGTETDGHEVGGHVVWRRFSGDDRRTRDQTVRKE